jgi:hypothetical protein
MALQRASRYLLCWLALLPISGRAEVAVIDPFDAGRYALRNNSAPSAVTLSRFGAQPGGEFIWLAAGQLAAIKVSGLPPWHDITLVEQSATLRNADGPTLTLNQLTPTPLALRSNGEGELNLTIGATLTSSGNGTPYPDGNYCAGLTLRFEFTTNAGVQHISGEVEACITLQTTLELINVQPLDFGRWVAIAHPTNQASATLTPRGTLSPQQQGAARLIPYGSGSRPGSFTISGAARFAAISVTPPEGEILLTHAANPAGSARLILRDITLHPASGAKTDENGAITFAIGGTLATELTHQRYADGLYSAEFTVNIEYQ